ncbi:MAG: lysine--tRNA ligase, partial [Bradymonadaceae bacterium]
MNAELKRFLDSFGFDYRFVSSRKQYRGGTFDEGLEKLVDHRQAVRDVIVPTLRDWRKPRWSAFFPICENCGKLYTTSVEDVDAGSKTIAYECSREPKGMTSCGHTGEVPVTGGRVKVGWKIDWALRWFTFD